MPITDDSGREAGWKGKLAFCGTFLFVSTMVFLMTFGVIRPSSDSGPPPPKWVGVMLGVLLSMGWIGPLAEPLFRRSQRAANAFGGLIALVIVGSLMAAVHWLLYKSARGLVGHGTLNTILNGISVLVLGAVALLFDGWIVYVIIWSIREVFGRKRR